MLPVVSYLGPMTAAAADRLGGDRDHLRHSRHRPLLRPGGAEPRLHRGDGRGDRLRGADHPAQSRRRPGLRPPRPEGEAATDMAHAGARRSVWRHAGEVEGRSLWQDARRRLFRNKAAVVSMVAAGADPVGAPSSPPGSARIRSTRSTGTGSGCRRTMPTAHLVRHRQQRPRPVRARALRRPGLAGGRRSPATLVSLVDRRHLRRGGRASSAARSTR